MMLYYPIDISIVAYFFLLFLSKTPLGFLREIVLVFPVFASERKVSRKVLIKESNDISSNEAKSPAAVLHSS